MSELSRNINDDYICDHNLETETALRLRLRIQQLEDALRFYAAPMPADYQYPQQTAIEALQFPTPDQSPVLALAALAYRRSESYKPGAGCPCCGEFKEDSREEIQALSPETRELLRAIAKGAEGET